MKTLKQKIEFVDADNKRARLTAEITERNGYPEFTLSGQYVGGHGQVIDHIKPANDDQKELVTLWTKYHLKDVSKMHNFAEHLEGVLARIEYAEKHKETKALEGDDAILEEMEQEGIDESQLEAVKAYKALNISDDLSDFQEAYAGEWTSDEAFAQNMADDIGAINSNATWPNNCIDWEQAARELMYDYSEQDGHYFRNM